MDVNLFPFSVFIMEAATEVLRKVPESKLLGYSFKSGIMLGYSFKSGMAESYVLGSSFKSGMLGTAVIAD